MRARAQRHTTLCAWAYEEARALGANWRLWQIGHQLSKLEQDSEEANALRRQSQEVLRKIVDTIPPVLRSAFLIQPEARAVLATPTP